MESQPGPIRRVARVALAVGLIGLGLAGAPVAHAGQGTGNPILTVTPTAMPGGGTVTVTGRDYLVPAYAEGQTVFGGVYVFFGYVEGTNWGPSKRTSTGTQGTFGGTYFYPGAGGDASSRGSSNGMVMVSFTPGGESGTQTQFHMDRNGNWTAPLAIPGPTFTTTLPSGGTRNFDCRQVTCGVFTIGAHGKTSATNEKFAPISFNGAGGAPQIGQQQSFQAPPGFPQQQFAPPQGFPPPQFAPPPQYLPPQQFAAPPQQAPPQQAPLQQVPPAAAPTTSTPTAAPTPALAAEPAEVPESLLAAQAEEAPSASTSLVAGRDGSALNDGELVAGTFGDGESSGGSPLLLGLAVVAGGGMAIALIRLLGSGAFARRLGAGSTAPQ